MNIGLSDTASINARFSQPGPGNLNLRNPGAFNQNSINSRNVPPIHMTLQLRLTIWYTALLGVTLILFSVLVYYFLDANLYSKVERDAEEQTPAIQQIVQEQLIASSSISTLVPTSSGDGDISFTLQLIEIPIVNVFVGIGDVQFFDLRTGKVLRSSNRLFKYPIPIQSDILSNVNEAGKDYTQRFIHKGIPLAVYSEAVAIGDRIIGVQILQNITPVENALVQIRQLLLVGTILSLALAALVGAYLAHRTLKPLKTITETASGITEMGDLGQRLSIPDESSEVGQLASTFNQMLNRIQQLFKTQEQLIADVSHELRTPLTTIQGNVELLQRFIKRPRRQREAEMAEQSAAEEVIQSTHQINESTTETMVEMLAEVEDEANRMGRMISDLLLLAQADSGELILQKEPVEIDTLLLEVYRQAQRMAERSKGQDGLVIRLGGEDQAMVLGDRERLRQLLLNLTGNAIKYTPIGGTITLSLKMSDEWIKVKVQDTGIGISEENQALIFGRFYRTDKARSRGMGGSGLGLSISQWIAHAHGGKIIVESKLQVGSEFTLWLPVYNSPV